MITYFILKFIKNNSIKIFVLIISILFSFYMFNNYLKNKQTNN